MGPKVSTILNNPLVYQHKYDEQICLCLERYRCVYSLHAANFACFLLSKLLILKSSFRNSIRMLNCFDPGQVRCIMRPDLGLNYLQMLSAVKEL